MDLSIDRIPIGDTTEDKKQRKQFIVDFYGTMDCSYYNKADF